MNLLFACFPEDAVPFVIFSPWWRRYDDYVISSDDYRSELMNVVGIRDVFCLFKDDVHVHIKAMELSSEASFPLESYENCLSHAFF